MKVKRAVSIIISICIIISAISVMTLAANTDVIGYTNKYTYVRMAPYWTASVVDNMASGVSITIIERDYEYLYIQYSKDNITKRGYIPRADTDATGYIWCVHDHFVPATCSATKTVCYADTGNISCGTIYSGEKPLLILRENTAKTHYFIQYTTNPSATGSTNPQFKRGWVTKASISISYTVNAPVPKPTITSQYALIRNHATNTLPHHHQITARPSPMQQTVQANNGYYTDL